MQRILAFVRLSRLQFLALPVLTYGIGIALVQRSLNHRLLVWGLVIELCAQLSVAYFNDYWDIPTDQINTRRTFLSGGSGELTTGLLPPITALIAGVTCQIMAVGLALIVGIPMISWLVLGLAIGAVLAYTTPPLSLAWRGVGEVTTAVVGAILVPAWAYSLQTGHLSADLLTVGFPLMIFIMALFVAIAAPDVEADQRVNKRTLPVIVGENRIYLLYTGLLILGYSFSIVLWFGRVPLIALIFLISTAPLGFWAGLGMRAPLSERPPVLFWMIIRAAFVPAIIVILLNIALRSS
jgi:1,4-dihydroxy-2-naphthoate octaprenyltransferase